MSGAGRPLRVMQVISDTNVGGAGRVVLYYLKYADRDRFELSAAIPEGSRLRERLEPLGVRILEVPGMADRSFHLRDVSLLRKIIRREKPDIVHAHGSLSARIAGRQCGAAVVFTRHSVFPLPGWQQTGPGRFANRLINLRYADGILAVSPAAKQNLTDGGVTAERITVCMNGVEPVARPNPETVRAFRARFNIPEGVFTAGILARFEPYKGHSDILEAARLLSGRGRDCRILMAGAGGGLDDVKRQAITLGLEKKVVFCGFLNDVAPFLASLSVQLNASWGTEATSLSLLEGFSMGVPAVASDYGGNPWVVRDGESGLIFPQRDAAALASRLERLMDDPALLTELGRGAEELYQSEFTGEAFARRTEAYYRKLLSGRRKV